MAKKKENKKENKLKVRPENYPDYGEFMAAKREAELKAKEKNGKS